MSSLQDEKLKLKIPAVAMLMSIDFTKFFFVVIIFIFLNVSKCFLMQSYDGFQHVPSFYRVFG